MRKVLLSFSLLTAFALYIPLSASIATTPNLLGPTPPPIALPSEPAKNASKSEKNKVAEIPEKKPAQKPQPVSQATTSPAQAPIPTPTPQPQPIPEPTPPPPQPAVNLGMYRDGEYTGTVADAYYGNIQVKAVIQSGRLADVQFLQYPNDRRTSIEINTQAMPYLKSEAIQAQNANVDIVSGATDTSLAFRQSLADALGQAKN